jgi:hypothetical protein
VFKVGPVAFEVGTVASGCGTVACFAGGAARASARVALAQLLDEILTEGAIDIGDHVGVLCEGVSQRVERGLKAVVVGAHVDAKASRDLRSSITAA